MILRAAQWARWLGYLALLAAAASVFGFVTPYAKDGIFNPATGGLGFYAHYVAFVVWVFLAGASMTLAQRRRSRAAAPASPPAPGRGGGRPVRRVWHFIKPFLAGHRYLVALLALILIPALSTTKNVAPRDRGRCRGRHKT